MKRVLLSVLALMLIGTFSALAGDSDTAKWSDDYKASADTAHEHGKMILLYFTGSDWCENCIKLDKAVLSKPEFAKWANKSFILVEIDKPHKKTLPRDVQDQNEALEKKYKVSEWPTIFVLDNNEVKLTVQRGYHDEEADKWIEKMDEAIKAGR